MLTVLLATLNGSKTINLFLKGMQKQTYDGEYEIIIVDNGSSDNTKEIINEYLNQLPIKYIFHPEKVKNKALNAGLEHVKGSFIIFTDDDIIPESDWLKQRAYHSGKGNFFLDYQRHIDANTPHPIRWTYRKIIKFYLKSIIYKVSGKFDEWFTASCRFKFYQGYVSAYKEAKNL